MSIISEPSPNKYFCVGKRGASFPYCNCRVKQFPSSIKLSSLSTVRTGVGIAAAVTSLPSQSGCLMCPPHRVCARGSEIALNKSHCAHHWLRHSPRATDPKNRAPETVATRHPASPSHLALFLSLLLLFLSIRVWWEKSTAASECRGRWNRRSLRWSWMQRWRRGWTHTSWKSGTAGMKTRCHPHTTSNPKPKCSRTTRTLWVQSFNRTQSH